MIFRIFDDERASVCDNLLTKLIQDERKYDSSIDKNFIVKDYFKNVIKNKDNILLCCEEDKIIKGYIYLKSIIANNKKGFLIDGLYVDENYRNNGIATNLMETALSIIKNTDVEFININVLAHNKNAINLYKKFGFSEFKINLKKDL